MEDFALHRNIYITPILWIEKVVTMGTTKPERVGVLKVGRYIVIDEEPCKIIAYSTSAPGKHGAAKARIDAKGIFDDQKRSIIKPVDAKVPIPIIDRQAVWFRHTWAPPCRFSTSTHTLLRPPPQG
jgi:hypothetical protein